TGVPSAEALSRDFAKLTPAMLGAVGTPPGEGFLDRLQSNAERLVRVRPIGEPAGDAPATIVARAEARANRGDLEGAVAELTKLPVVAKAPAAEWMKLAAA